MSGYIPISRKLFEHPFWTEKREFSRAEAWIDLLRSVRFEASPAKVIIGNRTVVIERGEIPASLRFLAERWQWSKNKVNTFLNLLKDEKMIEKRIAPGTAQTIIKICKYNTYNSVSKNKSTLLVQEKDVYWTRPGQQTTKSNKEEEKNNLINFPPFPQTCSEPEKNSYFPTKNSESFFQREQGKRDNSLEFPYSSEQFMNTWQNLMRCPKWKKKVTHTLQLALNRLAKFEEEYAILLMEMAAANDWQGLIFPDTEEKYLKWKNARTNKLNIVNHDNNQIYTKF